MNEHTAENMSAMMDGEAGEFELRRSLEQLEQSPEMAERWRRYHVARSAMRGEPVNMAEVDISASVMGALENEPTYNLSSGDGQEVSSQKPAAEPPQQAPRVDKNSLWKPMASMAIAASVTAMVILGVQNQGGDTATNVASSQPQYSLPATTTANDDLVRAQFGDRSNLTQPAGDEADVIRLSQGLERYIEQHRYLLSSGQPQWQADWLPDGFSNVRHEVTPGGGEMMMFSDGKKAVSVCIEDFGRQSVPEGVAQAEGMIAVGKRQGDKFITVVGEVPLVMAERIAASVSTLKQ
ncbi:MAG: MucB/RseB C-terminal domain-containing protein [Marinobacterium sp.]|nr:MucB/RseB C-terminal domain-containing protein [Marinobacterium sp.]